ncbi:cupin [Glycomyces paridis]|uniref:cupin n=1 Tax=Glycomyces paridis TaxID=2126555 RepID=UPI001864A574|nr:cupin [Glycomyces paridis]
MDDLNELAGDHLNRARAAAHGRSAVLVLHDGPLRQSLIALVSGTALSEHEAPDAGSLLVMRGRVRLESAGGEVEVGEGELAAIPRERHGLTALADSVVLLTTVTSID